MKERRKEIRKEKKKKERNEKGKKEDGEEMTVEKGSRKIFQGENILRHLVYEDG